MIITLTGPTCAGKTTLEAELTKLGVGRAISHTTRAPRAGEVDGLQYHFVSCETFDEMEMRGDFIENISFGKHSYALSADALELASRSFRHTVIVVEPHGAKQIRNHCLRAGLECVAVWVGCDPVDQAHRWVERVKADMEAGKDVSAHADRLHLMLAEETKWPTQITYELHVNTSAHRPADAARDLLNTVSDPFF